MLCRSLTLATAALAVYFYVNKRNPLDGLTEQDKLVAAGALLASVVLPCIPCWLFKVRALAVLARLMSLHTCLVQKRPVLVSVPVPRTWPVRIGGVV